jgi:hypothetical protein
MPGLKPIVLALALLIVAAVAIVAYGNARWARLTRELTDRLDAGRVPLAPKTFETRVLDALPAPVQRYLQLALQAGQRRVGAARFTHTGTFNLSATGENWRTFRSTQRVVVDRPGFVWDAGMAMVPGVPVRVHDAFVDGEGTLHAAVLGLLAVAHERGRGELARGELLRFLAETAWYPTALLPGPHLTWSPIDARSARASLEVDGTRAELVFTFNADGLIEQVRADSRARTSDGQTEMLPWEGRFWNYALRDGMQIPLDGEVAWITPQGRRPYWRGTIETIAHDFER